MPADVNPTQEEIPFNPTEEFPWLNRRADDRLREALAKAAAELNVSYEELRSAVEYAGPAAGRPTSGTPA